MPQRLVCRHARLVPRLAIGLVALSRCASLSPPVKTVLDLQTALATGDVAATERLAPLGVYTVMAGVPLGMIFIQACTPDFGGGTRCTLTHDCGGDDAALTLHLERGANRSAYVTAAAVQGDMRTVDSPDFGTRVFVYPCGVEGSYTDRQLAELDVFLASEVYSSTLVSWPYADPPSTTADTALAMSRLDANRGAIDDARAALQRALALGQDTASVVTTAVVEAGFALGLHLTPPHWLDPSSSAVDFVWHHGADAYPADTAVLRRGIELLDFAMGVPNAGVDWHAAPLLGTRGRDITFTHTPSIAAMEEMNGIAHYLLGRAYVQRARREPTCALWHTADEALLTGYGYLRNVPPVDEADDTDARLAHAADGLRQQADTARERVCKGTAA